MGALVENDSDPNEAFIPTNDDANDGSLKAQPKLLSLDDLEGELIADIIEASEDESGNGRSFLPTNDNGPDRPGMYFR